MSASLSSVLLTWSLASLCNHSCMRLHDLEAGFHHRPSCHKCGLLSCQNRALRCLQLIDAALERANSVLTDQ